MKGTTRRALEKVALGDTFDFYRTREWRVLAARVRKLDRGECQLCKARGRYTRGSIVHHVKELRDRPDLALSIYDEASGERQLITLCKRCHEEKHPSALRKNARTSDFAEYEECWE